MQVDPYHTIAFVLATARKTIHLGSTDALIGARAYSYCQRGGRYLSWHYTNNVHMWLMDGYKICEECSEQVVFSQKFNFKP